MAKMTPAEMAAAVRRYFRERGNPVLSSSAVYEDAFADQDKVRFQLVFSNMALQPPHEMIKIQEGAGTRGVKWRLRTPDDPPFVAPPKVPRAKRSVEITRPLASPADLPTPRSRIKHRDVAMVAETPAAIRALEREDTRHVEHRSLAPPPPNNALAAAISKALATPAKPRFGDLPQRSAPAREPVAAFANDKTLDYELAPDAKVVEVPPGHSGLASINKGAAKLPKFAVSGTLESTPSAAAEAVIQTTKEAYVDPDAREPAPAAPAAGVLPAGEPQPPADAQPAADDRMPEATRPVRKPATRPAPTLTLGQLLDQMITLAAPMFKAMITEAVRDALVEERIEVTADKQQITADIFTRITVPPPEQDKPEPRHRPLMPGELEDTLNTRLPKVTVIGLPKPTWEFEVKEKFAKWLNIRTVHADAVGKTAREACYGADHVILMTSYNPHKMDASLKAGNIDYERLGGGPGKLHDRLREIIASYREGVAQSEKAA